MNGLEPMADAFRRVQRRALVQLGKKVFRGTDESLARASRLGRGPLYDPQIFPWVPALEAAAGEIRGELEQLLTQREHIPAFQDISPAQARISDDRDWRVFAFYGFGERSAQNCELCPATARALDGIPGVYNALFSILAPGKHVPRHSGVTTGFIRCHLALIVPKQREGCRMDVDGSRVLWEEGKAVLFDDSRPHEVWNETDETRAVLLFDVPRPMTLWGRVLLALLMAVLRHTYYVSEMHANQRRWESRTVGVFGKPARAPAESTSTALRTRHDDRALHRGESRSGEFTLVAPQARARVKRAISMPVIQNGTGADSYFVRLARGLEERGHDVSLRFYPRRYEMSARWLGLSYRCPENADIVHTKAEHGFALRTRDVPVVMTLAHSVFDPLLTPHKSLTTAAYHQLVKRGSIQRSLERADAVVTVSEYSRQRIMADFGQSNVTAIYNGVDERHFRLLDEHERTFRDTWDQRRFKLFHVGNAMKRKGTDLLAPIMEALGDDFVLYYTGGFRGTDHGRTSGNMRCVGRLSDDELVAAYNECDALLFPSRMEGFGYPVAEAMACGKPVVCTDSSSMPELVDDGYGGRLCPIDDVDAFVEAVRQVAGLSSDSRIAMGEHNRQKVLERFTQDHCIRQYDDLYQSLARATRR